MDKVQAIKIREMLEAEEERVRKVSSRSQTTTMCMRDPNCDGYHFKRCVSLQIDKKQHGKSFIWSLEWPLAVTLRYCS